MNKNDILIDFLFNTLINLWIDVDDFYDNYHIDYGSICGAVHE